MRQSLWKELRALHGQEAARTDGESENQPAGLDADEAEFSNHKDAGQEEGKQPANAGDELNVKSPEEEAVTPSQPIDIYTSGAVAAKGQHDAGLRDGVMPRNDAQQHMMQSESQAAHSAGDGQTLHDGNGSGMETEKLGITVRDEQRGLSGVLNKGGQSSADERYARIKGITEE